jgi:hypothetical protein
MTEALCEIDARLQLMKWLFSNTAKTQTAYNPSQLVIQQLELNLIKNSQFMEYVVFIIYFSNENTCKLDKCKISHTLMMLILGKVKKRCCVPGRQTYAG